MAQLTRRWKVKGVDFVVNDEGGKKAVIIDLRRHGDLWEDFFDTMLARERDGDPRESLASVKRKILGAA